MNLLQISDESINQTGIKYIFRQINNYLPPDCACNLIEVGKRVGIAISCGDEIFSIIKKHILSSIAEVICILYKYRLFDEKVVAKGINGDDRELLLSAIIAADFDDDKRYAESKLTEIANISIDGFFNFRLQKLQKKWDEISEYIPRYFTSDELQEFLSYLINEKKGRKIFIENGCVYDGHNRKIERSSLMPKGDNQKLIKEVLLSGAGEVFVIDRINESDYAWLNKYFGKNFFNAIR